MPKGHRSMGSQSYYHVSPASTPTSATYAPISSRPSISNPYYVPVSSATISQPSYSTQSYSAGGPVQHPLSSPYIQLPPAPITTLRPSSGAWSPTDDQTLMAARAQGMNWAPIQQAYFPSKTPNACRKRHERLMERRNADDWDGLKLENLAKTYMTMRREIWSPLAAQTGEKWIVVEQKCMSHGLKNLQQAARSSARRDRILLDTSHGTLNNSGMSGGPGGPSAYTDHRHNDDSGISLDDLEAEYDADGASDHSGRSAGSGSGASNGLLGGGGGAYGGGYHHQMHRGGSRGGSGAGRGYHAAQQQLQQQHQRVPAMEMGIDAIINRPGGR